MKRDLMNNEKRFNKIVVTSVIIVSVIIVLLLIYFVVKPRILKSPGDSYGPIDITDINGDNEDRNLREIITDWLWPPEPPSLNPNDPLWPVREGDYMDPLDIGLEDEAPIILDDCTQRGLSVGDSCEPDWVRPYCYSRDILKIEYWKYTCNNLGNCDPFPYKTTSEDCTTKYSGYDNRCYTPLCSGMACTMMIHSICTTGNNPGLTRDGECLPSGTGPFNNKCVPTIMPLPTTIYTPNPDSPTP